MLILCLEGVLLLVYLLIPIIFKVQNRIPSSYNSFVNFSRKWTTLFNNIPDLSPVFLGDLH